MRINSKTNVQHALETLYMNAATNKISRKMTLKFFTVNFKTRSFKKLDVKMLAMYFPALLRRMLSSCMTPLTTSTSDASVSFDEREFSTAWIRSEPTTLGSSND